MQTYDIAIVGGGILGFAIARLISIHDTMRNLSCVVFEKHGEPALEASGRSSGVVHSAFHQPHQSLKARYSARGSVLAKAYARKRGIPLRECGMLIALPYGALWNGLWSKMVALRRLRERGIRNEVSFRFVWGQAGIRKIEPHVRAMGGIHIPDIAVVDGARLTRLLSEEAVCQGVDVLWGHEVIGIDASADSYRIATNRGFFRVRCLINAAGLFADEIANMALGEKRYHIWPMRGDYYQVVEEKRELVRGLVFPVMPSGAISKGMLLLRRPEPNGSLHIGPDARWVSRKDDYGPPSADLKEKFLAFAREFLPDIRSQDLQWSHAGIRPKLSSDGAERDFIVSIDRIKPLLIDLVGIDSPGISAGMGIAEAVVQVLELQMLG